MYFNYFLQSLPFSESYLRFQGKENFREKGRNFFFAKMNFAKGSGNFRNFSHFREKIVNCNISNWEEEQRRQQFLVGCTYHICMMLNQIGDL